MIPQRNLSTLANRLAVSGARRIPEAVLDRDYCLAWFLVGLSTTELGSRLAFKGGTALRRCYFGDYRFSEDLDFTISEPVTEQDIRRGVDAACEKAAALSAVAFVFDREDRHSHLNSFTFFMTYEGVWPRSGAANEVKVDVTLAERLVLPLERRPVLRGYPEFADIPDDAQLTVYSLGEIAAEKAIALMDSARNEPRDLYDMEFLITHGHVANVDMPSAIAGKLAFRGVVIKDAAAILDRKEKRLQALWAPRLGAQMQLLPEFDSVFRTVRRWFRQLGM
jgi:predicted nucleotidyltransferase component of viral defense system